MFKKKKLEKIAVSMFRCLVMSVCDTSVFSRSLFARSAFSRSAFLRSEVCVFETPSIP